MGPARHHGHRLSTSRVGAGGAQPEWVGNVTRWRLPPHCYLIIL